MSNQIEVKIKYLNDKCRGKINLPKYATQGSAGMDLCACIDNQIVIKPNSRVIIPSGIAIELPSNECVALVFARSGLAIKHGITLSNGVGVIDSDYRGEIKCGMINLGDREYVIMPGQRIAQMIFMPVVVGTLKVVNELGLTQRGCAGLGSTGI